MAEKIETGVDVMKEKFQPLVIDTLLNTALSSVSLCAESLCHIKQIFLVVTFFSVNCTDVIFRFKTSLSVEFHVLFMILVVIAKTLTFQ